jgi:ubiquinol-cytochrome c reductase cytochrome c subunit
VNGVRAAQLGVIVAVIGIGSLWVRPARSAAQSAPPRTGRFIFLRDCAVCHGADATGTNDGPSLQGVGRAAVDFWVSTGRMPLVSDPARDPQTRELRPVPEDQLGNPNAPARRHAPAYTPDVIAALVDYVATIAPGGPDIPAVSTAGADIATGGEVYRLECAACHSWAANGGALYQREAPSLSRATVTQIAEAIRTGPDEMPRFGTSAIPDDQLGDVVAYVQYLDHPNDRGGDPLWHLGPVAEGGVSLIGGMGALLLITRWIGERT